jgi:hypothetical protein
MHSKTSEREIRPFEESSQPLGQSEFKTETATYGKTTYSLDCNEHYIKKSDRL